MAYGIEPKEFSFPITKHSTNDDQHQHREGWYGKLQRIELPMSTAPPKAGNPTITEICRRKSPSTMTRTSSSRWRRFTSTFRKPKKCWERSKDTEKRGRKQVKTIASAKETAKRSLMARVIAVMGQTAPEKLLELAVKAVTMYEGKESGARQIKIDLTTAEKLQKN